MSKTLIILNPHADSGRAGQVWKDLEPLLWKHLGELVVAVTQHPAEVAQHLDKAYASGLTRVISIGGDGTNHALVNALVKLNERHPDGPPMVYGSLPIGTGRDWARSAGIPLKLEDAASWIAQAKPQATDIGKLNYNGHEEYFLNIASAGISGEVASRVNRSPSRKPWTFLLASIATVLSHRPPPITLRLDGETWYEGPAYIVAVANGTTFARGMKVAPDAKTNDGLFDVVLVEAMSRLRVLLTALPRVYSGSHLTHPKIQLKRAKQVQISSPAGTLGFELDGEQASGRELSFEVRPGLLQILS